MGLALAVALGQPQAAEIAAVIPAPLPANIEQLRAAAHPVLTSQLLRAYVARQQQMRSFNVTYYERPQALTVDVLNSYIARRNNPALAAIEAADVGTGLTADVMSAFVKNGYVTTPRRLEHAADEKLCLTQALYHEARGEGNSGQAAVANVIINRAMSRRYPSTICGVVFQNADQGRYRCQFTFACDGRSDYGTERQAWNTAARIADATYKQFARGQRPDVLPSSVMFYHTTAVAPQWSHTFQRVATIGSHVFYSPNR